MEWIPFFSKSANILFTKDDKPLLSDFGIAKVLDLEETVDLKATNLGVGTPSYMAPEQARGEPPTTASDVYSLGVVLYGLLTGRRPYEIDTTNPQKLLHTISHISHKIKIAPSKSKF